jgi:photosystem II stability/assembly factor-like uncharacterized protein
MKSAQRSILAALCLVVLCVSAMASTMQLLTPSTGWLLSGRLFWTEDNGGHWTDITPERPGRIGSVFFLDESRGWIALEARVNGLIRLELATTTNAGRNWSFVSVPIPKQYPDEVLGVEGVDFADAEHGWIVLREATSSAFSIGRLLATQDGGNTWHELPRTSLSQPVLFVNSTDGWMAGQDVGGHGFYHSRDGGKTWEGVDVPAPSSHSSVLTRETYGTLRFTDAKHGSIPVIFSPVTDGTKGSTLVLFTTIDGGKSWKADRVLPNLPNMYGQSPIPSVLVDSTLVTVAGAALTTIEPDGTASRKAVRGVSADTSFTEISFVSSTTGWLRTSDDRLLSTTDGGETLILLVPGSAPRILPNSPPPELPRAKTHP